MADCTLPQFNALSADEATQVLRQLCGSGAWCGKMADARPFTSIDRLHQQADLCFDGLSESDWLEAFAAHPKLGDVNSLRMKYAGNRQWSGGEQAGVAAADEKTLADLVRLNEEFESRFGFIFILCATGKSASQMLDLLRERLHAPSDQQAPLAAAQQRKITHLRIDKLFL